MYLSITTSSEYGTLYAKSRPKRVESGRRFSEVGEERDRRGVPIEVESWWSHVLCWVGPRRWRLRASRTYGRAEVESQ